MFIFREHTRAPHIMSTLRLLSNILPWKQPSAQQQGPQCSGPVTGRAQASPELAWPPSPSSSHMLMWLGHMGPGGRSCGLACRRDKLAWGQDWGERRRPQCWKCHWNSLCNKARLYKSVCPSIQKGPYTCILCITYALLCTLIVYDMCMWIHR